MAFSWADFLTFVDSTLAEKSPSEAKLRIANSRCYYGPRGYISELQRRVHGIISMKSNKELLDWVRVNYPTWHGRLRSLWEARVAADYHLRAPVTPVGVGANLALARELVSEIKAAAQSPNPLVR